MSASPRIQTVLVTMAVVVFLLALATGADKPRDKAQPSAAESAEPPREIELRGRVVCLPEEMHRLHGAGLPTKHDHIWGFRADDGKLYTLLRGKFSEAIFLDERLRDKELLLKARLFPKTQIIEVMLLRSIRNGVVHDLYYYCDICDIESVSPEACACCQGPVELVEKPLVASRK
jgi:hypothetical protein